MENTELKSDLMQARDCAFKLENVITTLQRSEALMKCCGEAFMLEETLEGIEVTEIGNAFLGIREQVDEARIELDRIMHVLIRTIHEN